MKASLFALSIRRLLHLFGTVARVRMSRMAEQCGNWPFGCTVASLTAKCDVPSPHLKLCCTVNWEYVLTLSRLHPQGRRRRREPQWQPTRRQRRQYRYVEGVFSSANPHLTLSFFAAATIEDSSSSTTAPETKKRRVREDYRIKYAYLDYVNMIDMRGLECLVSRARPPFPL